MESKHAFCCALRVFGFVALLQRESKGSDVSFLRGCGFSASRLSYKKLLAFAYKMLLALAYKMLVASEESQSFSTV